MNASSFERNKYYSYAYIAQPVCRYAGFALVRPFQRPAKFMSKCLKSVPKASKTLCRNFYVKFNVANLKATAIEGCCTGVTFYFLFECYKGVHIQSSYLMEMTRPLGDVSGLSSFGSAFNQTQEDRIELSAPHP